MKLLRLGIKSEFSKYLFFKTNFKYNIVPILDQFHRLTDCEHSKDNILCLHFECIKFRYSLSFVEKIYDFFEHLFFLKYQSYSIPISAAVIHKTTLYINNGLLLSLIINTVLLNVNVTKKRTYILRNIVALL